MPRHKQHIHRHPRDLLRPPLAEQQIRPHRLELDIEPVLLEKRPVRDHRRRIGMERHPAPVPPHHRRRIHHMVEMPVRQHQPINPLPREMPVGILRRIE